METRRVREICENIWIAIADEQIEKAHGHSYDFLNINEIPLLVWSGNERMNAPAGVPTSWEFFCVCYLRCLSCSRRRTRTPWRCSPLKTSRPLRCSQCYHPKPFCALCLLLYALGFTRGHAARTACRAASIPSIRTARFARSVLIDPRRIHRDSACLCVLAASFVRFLSHHTLFVIDKPFATWQHHWQLRLAFTYLPPTFGMKETARALQTHFKIIRLNINILLAK